MNCAQASSDKASRGAGGSLLRYEGDRHIFTITNVHEPLLQNTCFELGDSGQTGALVRAPHRNSWLDGPCVCKPWCTISFDVLS